MRSVRQCSVCAARGITIRETIGNVCENLSLHVIDTIREGIHQLLVMYYSSIDIISWSFITLNGGCDVEDLESKNCFISIYLNLHLISSYHAHILETIPTVLSLQAFIYRTAENRFLKFTLGKRVCCA